MDKVIELSLKEKIKLLGKILLLAQVAENYSENKKVLGYVRKTAETEAKLLKKAKYALIPEDSRSSFKYVNEFITVVKSLAKAKRADLRRLAEQSLQSYIEKLTAQILSDERALLPPAPKPVAPIDEVKKVIDTAASGVRKLGDMIDRGVEQIKKTVHDTLHSND